MNDMGPSGLSDQLWRSSLTVLFTVAVIYVSWQLLQRLLGPLILIVVLLGILRLATGWRGRNRW
jgi:hypothetical protein